MNRLDEIKARWEKAKPPHGSSDAVRAAAQDVPALVAAVEAVLALHAEQADGYGKWTCRECVWTDEERVGGPVPYPCDTVITIRDALGETE